MSPLGTPPHLLHRLVLGRRGAVVRVLLGAQRAHVPALPHLAVLLVFVRQLLDVSVRLAAAQPAHRAGQPLAQRVALSGGKGLTSSLVWLAWGDGMNASWSDPFFSGHFDSGRYPASMSAGISIPSRALSAD